MVLPDPSGRDSLLPLHLRMVFESMGGRCLKLSFRAADCGDVPSSLVHTLHRVCAHLPYICFSQPGDHVSPISCTPWHHCELGKRVKVLTELSGELRHDRVRTESCSACLESVNLPQKKRWPWRWGRGPRGSASGSWHCVYSTWLLAGRWVRTGLLTSWSRGPQDLSLPFLGEPPTGQRGSVCHGGGDGAG